MPERAALGLEAVIAAHGPLGHDVVAGVGSRRLACSCSISAALPRRTARKTVIEPRPS